MKKALIILITFLTTLHAQAQSETKPSFDGLYIAKTGSVPAAGIDIFTYLRFYDDGTVYMQTVSSNDPEAVSKWFGRKKYSQKGTYKMDGDNIVIQLDNKDTEDAKLEGPVETNYKGSIKAGNQICLNKDKEVVEKCFAFSKTN